GRLVLEQLPQHPSRLSHPSGQHARGPLGQVTPQLAYPVLEGVLTEPHPDRGLGHFRLAGRLRHGRPRRDQQGGGLLPIRQAPVVLAPLVSYPASAPHSPPLASEARVQNVRRSTRPLPVLARTATQKHATGQPSALPLRPCPRSPPQSRERSPGGG